MESVAFWIQLGGCECLGLSAARRARRRLTRALLLAFPAGGVSVSPFRGRAWESVDEAMPAAVVLSGTVAGGLDAGAFRLLDSILESRVGLPLILTASAVAGTEFGAFIDSYGSVISAVESTPNWSAGMREVLAMPSAVVA